MKKTALIFIMLFLLGCNPIVRIVEVPKIHTEYTHTLLRDSIIMTDSVTVAQKGDTVFNTKTKYVFKYKFQKDTVNKTDTLTLVKVEKIPIVTNKLNAFQRFSIWGFWCIIVIFISLFIIKKRYFF